MQLDLLSPELTLGRYQAVLRAFYGYYRPLEARLAAVAPALREFPPASRAPLLVRDMVALGATHTELARLSRCTHLPRVSGAAAAAGCLYVVEGAALGGQVIGESLERRLGIGRHSGSSFFLGEGSGTAARWRTVLGAIESLAAQNGAEEQIVSAACETFDTLSCWFDRAGVAA